MNPPAAPTLLTVAKSTTLSAIPQAVTHYWAVTGSCARKEWRQGHDVDLRSIYALPARDYLGLNSFWDETEEVVVSQGLELDIVAFEIGKLARLLLKGHEPTLDWLRSEHCLYQSDTIAPLQGLAALRAERLGEAVALPPEAYDSLNNLVVALRMGASDGE